MTNSPLLSVNILVQWVVSAGTVWTLKLRWCKKYIYFTEMVFIFSSD